MSLENWPVSDPPAPCVAVAGYGLDHLEHVVRTDMETGAPKTRLRQRKRFDRVQVEWTMSTRQFYHFRDWFESPTGAHLGNRWFTIDLQAGQNDQGAATTEQARFATQWTMAMLGPAVCSVKATLEVREP